MVVVVVVGGGACGSLAVYAILLLIELFPDCGSHDYVGEGYWSVWFLHKFLSGYVVIT